MFRRISSLAVLIISLTALFPSPLALHAQDQLPSQREAAFIDAAMQHLSRKLGKPQNRNITAWEFRHRIFVDTSIDCPVEGNDYERRLAAGYLIRLTAPSPSEFNGQVDFIYYATKDGQRMFECTASGPGPNISVGLPVTANRQATSDSNPPAKTMNPCSSGLSTDPNLVAHYAFENDGNNTSNNQQHGIISPEIQFKEGICHQAAWFDDKLDVKITIPHSAALDVSNAFTLAVWVYPTSYRPSAAHSHFLVSQWYTSSKIGDYILRLSAGENAGILALIVANTEGNTFRSEQVSVPDHQKVPLNTWSHVAAVFDKGLVRLYLNGILIVEKRTSIQYTEASAYEKNDLVIGNLWTNDYYQYGFVGGLDELHVYDRALTSQEIQMLVGIDLS
jgi:hypothetical protein